LKKEEIILSERSMETRETVPEAFPSERQRMEGRLPAHSKESVR